MSIIRLNQGGSEILQLSKLSMIQAVLKEIVSFHFIKIYIFQISAIIIHYLLYKVLAVARDLVRNNKQKKCIQRSLCYRYITLLMVKEVQVISIHTKKKTKIYIFHVCNSILEKFFLMNVMNILTFTSILILSK